MAERREIGGWIYEMGADGVPRRIGPAQPQPAPRGDPRIAPGIRNQEAGTARTQVQAQGDAITNAFNRATFEARAAQARADARKAAADASRAERVARAPVQEEVDQNRRAGRLNSLVGQINRVEQLYRQNIAPEPLGPFSSIADKISFLPRNEQFDTAGAQLSEQGLAAFRIPGQGTSSDRDSIMFDKANAPTSGKADTAIEEQLRGMRARIEEEYRSLGLPAPKWETGGGNQSRRQTVRIDQLPTTRRQR